MLDERAYPDPGRVVNRLMNIGISGVEHGELRAADLATVAEQLGREPTIPFTVVARCTGGHPLVIRNAPVDADGAPFPTTSLAHLSRRGQARLAGWKPADGSHGSTSVRTTTRRSGLGRGRTRGGAPRIGARPQARAWWCRRHAPRHQVPRTPTTRTISAGGDDVVGAMGRRARRAGARGRSVRDRVAAIDQGTNSCRLLVRRAGARRRHRSRPSSRAT